MNFLKDPKTISHSNLLKSVIISLSLRIGTSKSLPGSTVSSVRYASSKTSKMDAKEIPSSKRKIAICQFTCKENIADNFDTCKNLVIEAKNQGAEVCFRFLILIVYIIFL